MHALRLRLKDATAPIHDSVEAELQLLDPGLSRERYRRVLADLYGFYVPTEAGLAAFAQHTALGLALRDRSALLRGDLVALGLREPDAVPRCTEVPRPVRVEDAAGSLYVLEGASLGGQVVARAVRRSLGLATASGASFFVGDGDGTGARWSSVLGWLEASVATGARSEAIVEAACATFRALARWLARCRRG